MDATNWTAFISYSTTKDHQRLTDNHDIEDIGRPLGLDKALFRQGLDTEGLIEGDLACRRDLPRAGIGKEAPGACKR